MTPVLCGWGKIAEFFIVEALYARQNHHHVDSARVNEQPS